MMDNQSVLESSKKYTYKLCLHDNIADSNKKLDDLTLIQLKATKFTLNKASYSVSLNSIQFNRKVYQPGQIVAEILFTLLDSTSSDATIISPEDLKELLLQRRVSLSYAEENEEGNFVIAKDYYVHEISPKLKRGSSKTQLFVRLYIFSMDKLMTLNKYSKAYVCKKLGSQILNEESKLFNFENAMLKIYTDNMQNLRYKQKEKSDDIDVTISSEFIQPYLVQYNETFYDFMARTANRCGEFFFFDGGQLTLGLSPDSSVYNIKNYDFINYSDISSAPLSIKAFARDSVKGTKEPELNDSPVDKAGTGFPENTFGTDLSYNSELTHEDYIFPMFKDKFTNYGRELAGPTAKDYIAKLALDVFKEVVGNTKETSEGAKEIGKSLAMTYLERGINAYRDVKSTNETGNTFWIENNEKNSEQCNGTSFYQFSTVSDEGWLKLTYYSEIRKMEKAQQEKVICIDMGTHIVPVCLGDTVTIDKVPGKFIVIQIDLVASNKEGSSGYMKYGDEQSLHVSGNLQSQQIYAIPYTADGKAYPPMISGSVIRKSGPQTAFVVDNSDPKKQGRVRIAYPWQAVGDKVRQTQLKEATEKCNECKANVEFLDKEKKKSDKVLAFLKEKNAHLDAALQDLKTKDAEGQKEYLQNLRKKNESLIQSNQERINAIDADMNASNPGSTAAELASAKDSMKKTGFGTASNSGLFYTTLIAKVDKLNRKIADMEMTKEDLNRKNELYKSLETELAKNDKGNTPPIDFIEQNIKNREKNEIAAANEESKKLGTDFKKASEEMKQAETTKKKLGNSWKDQLLEVSSPWVRIASPMATYEGGVFFRPMIGDEVLVNYDNENVERPYVTGSLYSKENLDPSGNMTIKSPSGQKIMFSVAPNEDSFVSSVFPFISQLGSYVPAFKPSLGKDSRKLCGGITLTDEYGLFSVNMSSDNRSVSVSSPFGVVNVSAFTGINISAPNGDIRIKGKNVSIEAGNNIKLSAGQNVSLPGEPGASGDKKVHQPGFWAKTGKATSGAVKDGIGLGVDYGVNLVKDQFKGFAPVDMGLLRCVADVFLRPIEGTLCVKSKNYVMLEAGKGEAKVTNERYSQNWRKFKGFEEDADKQIFYAKTNAYINRIKQKVNQFCDDYVELKRDALKKQKEYDEKIVMIWNKDKDKPKFMQDAFKLGDTDFKKNDDSFEGGTVDLSVIKKENLVNNARHGILTDKGILTNYEMVKRFINPPAEAYAEAAWRLQKKAHGFKTCFSDDTIKAVNQASLGSTSDKDTEWIDKAFKSVVFDGNNNVVDKMIELWESRFGSKGSSPKDEFLDQKAEYDSEDIFTDSKLIKRKMVALFMLKLFSDEKNEVKGAVPGSTIKGKYFKLSYDSEATLTDDFLNKNWNEVVALGPKETKGAKVKNIALKYLDKLTGVSEAWSPVINKGAPYLGWDRRVWSDKSGKIIFSDTANSTFALNGENIEKWSQAALSNEESLKQTLNSL